LFGIENPAFGAENLAIFLRGIWAFSMWYIQWTKKDSRLCLMEIYIVFMTFYRSLVELKCVPNCIFLS
jgi:hypothetical protein